MSPKGGVLNKIVRNLKLFVWPDPGNGEHWLKLIRVYIEHSIVKGVRGSGVSIMNFAWVKYDNVAGCAAVKSATGEKSCLPARVTPKEYSSWACLP